MDEMCYLGIFNVLFNVQTTLEAPGASLSTFSSKNVWTDGLNLLNLLDCMILAM